MAPIRLAVLEAGTLAPRAEARYTNFTGVFTSLLTTALAPSPLDLHFTITGHHVVDNKDPLPAIDDVDAILITGSKYSVYDDEAWITTLVEYTKKAIEGGRVKVIGVCFGHQIVGKALGIEVGKSQAGWELAVTQVDLTDEGKKVFGLEKMRIHQVHQDEVKYLPRNMVDLASSPACHVQAMYLPGRYLTVQGHPEFTGDIMREVSGIRYSKGAYRDEVYADMIQRVGLEHDGVAIAQAFIIFLKK
ncbi:related to P.aeruginosa anthranilate synthase component II [Cephalotrichum gorgonifer]|uniref:Related to P.aeruginosa anthranilate synthase component II n=1 Tax=Cephalotrichum gorgonifer TaxID=2041049 RepID=A0AAE8MW70_9PEZI|nr:related to P.aeruginosa anthranilate synthase component II [Cephalotrichum gorgonifer]